MRSNYFPQSHAMHEVLSIFQSERLKDGITPCPVFINGTSVKIASDVQTQAISFVCYMLNTFVLQHLFEFLHD
ncbi:uncharacterized protein PHALS_04234 [Plasmopara halstedii]|uniref:Uncharacterized protein n=1 Tax=Plasmopara halstedii TaxID=4781 RepID=A0A0P1AZN4_PLAHL|nr:uncharacterized protein PHALS_04234 [Plasmopara halstedii]CEG47351.1 hypothetical protein PHALS_04234 [Plasmopara halstedii]|eukprot:XP_024583720.1 hypothetical protein PHALS_04234 [Plasmopara halstedii]